MDINPGRPDPLFDVDQESDWEQREVFNHIAPNLETRLSRLGKMKPILKARPWI